MPCCNDLGEKEEREREVQREREIGRFRPTLLVTVVLSGTVRACGDSDSGERERDTCMRCITLGMRGGVSGSEAGDTAGGGWVLLRGKISLCKVVVTLTL